MTNKDRTTDNTEKIWKNFGNFWKNFSIGFAGIIVFVIFGTTGLFMTKVAQVIEIEDDNVNINEFNNNDNNNNNNNNDSPVSMTTTYLLGLKGFALWDMFLNDKVKFEQFAKFKQDEGLIKNPFDNPDNPDSDDNPFNTTTPIINDICYHTLSYAMTKSFSGIKKTFKLFTKLNESTFMFLFGMFGLILLPFFFMYNFLMTFVSIVKSFGTASGDFFKGIDWDKIAGKTKEANSDTNDNDTNDNDTNADDTNTNDTNADTNADDTNTNDTNTNDTNTNDTNADDTNVDDTNANDNTSNINIGNSSQIILNAFKNIYIFLLKGLYVFIIFGCMIITIFVLPFISTFWSILKTLTAKYDLMNKSCNLSSDTDCKKYSSNDGKSGLGSFIADVFFRKHTLWVGLTILNLFTYANTWLGDTGMTSAFIAAVVLAIWPGIFKTCVSKEDKDMFITLIKTDSVLEKEKIIGGYNITSLLKEYNTNIQDGEIQKLITKENNKSPSYQNKDTISLLNEILSTTKDEPELKDLNRICNKSQLKWVFNLLQILHPELNYYDDDIDDDIDDDDE